VIGNLQTTAGNWQSFAQIGPDFLDCAAPCPLEATWGQTFGVASPSKSGNATEFSISPHLPYADVLFTAGVLGVNAPQRLDANHTLLPTIHHYQYDADFYVSDPAVSQALEFDVSVWMDGIAGMTFGHQCNHLGDGDWDIWDNGRGHWVDAKVPCKFVQGWNHVTLQMERQSDNSLLYQSIALNGTTYTLNQVYPSIPAPAGWWGVNLNYQMDSDFQGSQNTTYLDNLTFTYW